MVAAQAAARVNCQVLTPSTDPFPQRSGASLIAAKEKLTAKEKKELARLTEELGGLDATLTLRDPLYERFVEAMTVLGYDRDLLTAKLTREQRRKQQKLAVEILESMKKDRNAPR
jgi:hypothetical protein